MCTKLTPAGNAQHTERSGLAGRLARVRARQLDLARAGRVIESARLATRAGVLRAALARRASQCLAAVALAPAIAVAQPVATVRTAEVTSEVVQEHRRVTGSLQAVSRAAVAAQEAGLVEGVRVDEGSVVEKGDVIATLDARRLRAQLEEARAEHANGLAIVEQRTLELRFAEVDLDRIREAFDQGASNSRELSEGETLVGVRRSQLDGARRLAEQVSRRIELLEIRVRDTTIRAPFDARVVARHVEPGEWIEPGEPVVTLVSTGLIEARLEVPERYAPTVLNEFTGLYVELASDGRTIPSLEVRPVHDVDPRARTFQVYVTLDNGDGDLAPGMSVNAWVPTSDRSEALLAPKDAVIRNGRDAYVYRLSGGEGAQAERVPVRVLFGWSDRLAIASDALGAGDTVVVEGNERLAPGSPVVTAALGTARAN